MYNGLANRRLQPLGHPSTLDLCTGCHCGAQWGQGSTLTVALGWVSACDTHHFLPAQTRAVPLASPIPTGDRRSIFWPPGISSPPKPIDPQWMKPVAPTATVCTIWSNFCPDRKKKMFLSCYLDEIPRSHSFFVKPSCAPCLCGSSSFFYFGCFEVAGSFTQLPWAFSLLRHRCSAGLLPSGRGSARRVG